MFFMETLTVTINGERTTVPVIRKKRRCVALMIRGGEVIALAPFGVTLSHVLKFVLSKTGWIEKHLAKEKARSGFNDDHKGLKRGDKIRMLGKTYSVVTGEFVRPYAAGEEVFLPEKKADEAFADFWLGRALPLYEYYFERYFPQFERYGAKKPALKVKKYKAAWGKCDKTEGFIYLNYFLYKADERAVAYVVMHELCHLIHSGHQKPFHTLLNKLMPDYKERKKLLDKETTFS